MQTITISTPSEDLIVSQNGNKPPESSNELEKLLKANTTLAVWLIFLGLGGGLLALYYIRIGYLPEMEWNAALVYLFVCSVWGGVIGLLLTISLYLPGVIWCDIIIFESILDSHLSFYPQETPSGKRSSQKEPCIQSIMMWLGAPFFLALVGSHLLLRISDKSINERIDRYWIWAGLVLVATFILMQVIFRSLLKGTEGKTISRQIFKYSFWFTVSVLLNQISMYVIYRLADRTPNDDDFHMLTVFCTIGVLISTLVVAVRHQRYPRQALVAALVAAVVLLFTADRFSDLAMKLMNRYGVGEGKEVVVVVNEKGSKTLKDLGFTEGTWRLEKVNILSKMGDHYFVKIGPHSFTLPKSEVESIHRFNPDATIR